MKTAFYKRITENPIVFPDGIARELSYKTLEKWVSNYQREGIDALMPSERSDKGTTRVLPDTAIEEIYRLKQAFPRLNATQIHAQLVRDGFIPETVSVCAVHVTSPISRRMESPAGSMLSVLSTTTPVSSSVPGCFTMILPQTSRQS